jgi:hypothetical protein
MKRPYLLPWKALPITEVSRACYGTEADHLLIDPGTFLNHYGHLPTTTLSIIHFPDFPIKRNILAQSSRNPFDSLRDY